jgi:hypothetical protein
MNYPKRVLESIETLRMIEQAVTQDSMKDAPEGHDNLSAFVEAVRYRVANAVAIYCSMPRGE